MLPTTEVRIRGSSSGKNAPEVNLLPFAAGTSGKVVFATGATREIRRNLSPWVALSWIVYLEFALRTWSRELHKLGLECY